MAGTNVWPVDAVSGAPVYSGRHGRQLSVAPFLAGATATRPLGARSGVRPGTPTTTVTATSTTWTVGEHAGVIDAELAAEAGPYTYSIDAVQTGTMTAADPSSPRIDLISVQISDSAESDGTPTTTPASAAPIYTVGTPGATPAVPAAPARSMVLAQINVPVAGGGSPSVIWVAPYLSSPGGIITVRTWTERGAVTGTTESPAWVDELSTGTLWRGIGSAWVPMASASAWDTYTPVWAASTTAPALGNGSLYGRYRLLGKTCQFSVQLAIGSTTNGGSGTWSLSLPFAAEAWQQQSAAGWLNSNGAYIAPLAAVISGSSISGIVEGRTQLQSGYALAAGSVIVFTGTYEIA